MHCRAKSPIRLILCVALCALLLPVSHAESKSTGAKSAEPSSAAFPNLTVYTLSKTKLQLPKDFSGRINLLLISFRPEQQTAISTWMPMAEALQHTNFDFHWYQMPVAARENFIFRWWDNSSMRSDETDPEMWPWIVPLYINVRKFRRSLQIPVRNQIAVRLVDQDGRVLWSAEGPMTPAKRSALNAAVASAGGRSLAGI